MRIITYASASALRSAAVDRTRVEGLLRRTAEATDTTGLVVLLEVTARNSGWGGSFCTQEVTPKRLGRMKGAWRQAHSSGIPPGLPESFPLIEMRIGLRSVRYPRIEYNRNGFKLWFSDFASHLTYLFGHELHHFRRYCLDMHHREGEKSADRWAVARAKELGYSLELAPFKRRKPIRTRPRRMPAAPTIMPQEEWDRIRSLPKGSSVCLTKSDSRKLPAGTIVEFIRPMRASYRALVRDMRGDERLVPIEWLRIPGTTGGSEN